MEGKKLGTKKKKHIDERGGYRKKELSAERTTAKEGGDLHFVGL